MINLENEVFGRWRVVKELPRGKNNSRYWECVCECGIVKGVLQTDLVHNKSTMCRSCSTSKINTKHGKCGHRLYNTWGKMRGRCSNINDKDYHLYGGKGIRVCDEWVDFATFLSDMGSSYFEGAYLDRVYTDKNYCKENCRWVTPQQSSQNTSGKSSAKSKYKGVSFKKELNKYYTQCKHTYVGYYISEIEAANAYDIKAEELYGEFAWLNREYFTEVMSYHLSEGSCIKDKEMERM